MKPFSRAQNRSVITTARKAFDHLGKQAQERGEVWDDSKEAFDNFRHEQVMAAVGKPGLRACGSDNYLPCLARFQSLIGRDDRALNSLLDAQTDKRRRMEFLLIEELQSAGLSQAYAESISRSRFGVSVTQASDAQFKQLLITIKARVRAKRRKQTEAEAA